MMYAIFGLFSLGAILGITLLSFILREKETPKGAAILHGLFAAAGIVLLIIYCLNDGPGPIESLVLFLIAASGGIIVFVKDITNKKIPKYLAVIHGLVAVAGFIFLILFAINMN